MPLDSYLASKLHLMEDMDFHAMDADMAARMTEFYEDPEPWALPAEVDVSESAINGPHGLIPYRQYRSPSPSGTVLIWVHGGGFAFGDLASLESHMVAAELAARSGATVVSVDYRLARDGVHYPVPLDDVHAVLLAALNQQLSDVAFGGRVCVGGASAGAALALAAALRVRDASAGDLGGVLLAYPFVHFPNPGLPSEIAAELAVLPPSLRFPPADVEWMVGNYVGRTTAVPAYALPGGADLTGLPATSIVVSEYDDLRSSGELLHRQLLESAVPAQMYVAPGMLHGHLNRGTALLEVKRSLDFFAETLR